MDNFRQAIRRSMEPLDFGSVNSGGKRAPPSWYVSESDAALRASTSVPPGMVYHFLRPVLFDPETNRPLLPRIRNFIALGRYFREIDLHLFDSVLRAYGFDEGRQGHAQIPCPFAQNPEVRALHTTQPTRSTVWRVYVGGGGLLESARVHQELCVTCDRMFDHTNTAVLSRLPCAILQEVGVSPDSSNGVDSDFVYSPAAIAAMRADGRMRQGGCNREEHHKDQAGVEYAVRMQQYTEHSRLWVNWLLKNVSDDAWKLLSVGEKAKNAQARAELLEFQGATSFLDVVHPDPNVALHSPSPNG